MLGNIKHWFTGSDIRNRYRPLITDPYQLEEIVSSKLYNRFTLIIAMLSTLAAVAAGFYAGYSVDIAKDTLEYTKQKDKEDSIEDDKRFKIMASKQDSLVNTTIYTTRSSIDSSTANNNRSIESLQKLYNELTSVNREQALSLSRSANYSEFLSSPYLQIDSLRLFSFTSFEDSTTVIADVFFRNTSKFTAYYIDIEIRYALRKGEYFMYDLVRKTSPEFENILREQDLAYPMVYARSRFISDLIFYTNKISNLAPGATRSLWEKGIFDKNIYKWKNPSSEPIASDQMYYYVTLSYTGSPRQNDKRIVEHKLFKSPWDSYIFLQKSSQYFSSYKVDDVSNNPKEVFMYSNIGPKGSFNNYLENWQKLGNRNIEPAYQVINDYKSLSIQRHRTIRSVK